MTQWAGGLLVLATALVLACQRGPAPPPGYRGYTKHYAITIAMDPAPPYAREKTNVKVVVRDKDSGQPIDGGEGIIYANTQDLNGRTWDSFVPGSAPGTYRATLNFIIAGNWAVGLQFRRDSTQQLEKMDDWYQQVLNARAEH